MKKFLVFLLVTVFVVFSNPAKALDPFWFNGVALDATGQIRDNVTANVRISIYQGTTLASQEVFSGVTTSQFAIFAVEVGTGTGSSIGPINAAADTRIHAEVQDPTGAWILSSVQSLAFAMENSIVMPGNIVLDEHYIIIGDADDLGEQQRVGGELTATNTGTVASFIINDDAVTAAKINPDVAGAGLVQNGTTGALDVQNTDGSITVSANDITLEMSHANTWTGQQIFNTSNPRTPLAPVVGNDLTNKTYVDAQDNLRWSITGNSGLTAGTNFLGTTDNVDLVFKVNNQQAGRITNTLNNTSLGYESFISNTTGNNNVAIGSNALSSNTANNDIVAIGYRALTQNGIGASGSFEGHRNTAIGSSSLTANRTGYYNTAAGWISLTSNTSGASNSAFGVAALNLNTTGGANSAFGMHALNSNTTGGSNTSAGYMSLYYADASLNAAFGYRALFDLTTGAYNTAIGATTNVSAGNLSNVTVLGYGAVATASNQVRLGNASVTSLYSMGATAPSGNQPNMYVDAATGQIMRSTTLDRTFNNLTVNGNTILGSDDADDITVNGEFVSSLIPNATNTYSLGSDALRWRDLWVDGSSVHIGTALATEMMLGYSANTGTINVNGGNPEISIIDGPEYINFDPAATGNYVLQVRADGLNVATGGGAALRIQDDGLRRLGAGPETFTFETTGGGALDVTLANGSDLTVNGDGTFNNIVYVHGSLQNNELPGGGPVRVLDDFYQNLGTVSLGGQVTAWNAIIGKNNLTIEGNTILGTDDANNVTFNADVNSNIIPNVTGNFDLGSATFEWDNVYANTLHGAMGYSLTDGNGIADFTYNGSAAATVTVAHDATLEMTGTTPDAVLGMDLDHSNTWTVDQTFSTDVYVLGNLRNTGGNPVRVNGSFWQNNGTNDFNGAITAYNAVTLANANSAPLQLNGTAGAGLVELQVTGDASVSGLITGTVTQANNLNGGAAGSVPYQSAANTTTFLGIGGASTIMTSTGAAPQWVASLTDAQVDNNLTIVGGTINSTPIGATNPSTGAFTSLSASSTATFTGTSFSRTGTTTTFDGTSFNVTATGITFAGTGFNVNSVNTDLNSSRIYLGDATTDRIYATGYFGSSLIPASTIFDLGSDTDRWGDLFLSGSSIHMGSTGAEVVISYTGGALTFDKPIASSTAVLQINDPISATGADISGNTYVDNLDVSGDISDVGGDGEVNVAANMAVTGTFNAGGATTLDGAVTLGDNIADNITFTGSVASVVLPNADNSLDLGATTLRWQDVYALNYHGALTGNAATATALQNARDFSMSGDVSAPAVSFDGTGNVNLVTTVADDSHNHTSTTLPTTIVYDGDAAGGDLSGTFPNPQIASGVIVDADVNASAAIAVTKLAAGGANQFLVNNGTNNAWAGLSVGGTLTGNGVGSALGINLGNANTWTGTQTFTDLTVNGNTTLGSDVADNITVNGEFVGSLVPDTDDLYDLGTSTQRWRDLYITGATINMGDNTNNGDIGYNTTTNDFTFNQDLSVTGAVAATSFSGPLTGNAATATALQTARDFSVSGDVTAPAVSFDGTGNVVLVATVVDDSHNHTSTTLPAAIVYDTELTAWTGSTNITTLGTIGTGTWQGTPIADAYIPNNITIDLATAATNVNNGAANQLVYQTAANTTGFIAAGTDAQILGNNTGVPTWVTASGDATISNSGVITVADDSHAHTASTIPTDIVYDADLAAWTGSANITTVGTITTGTWNGTTIAIANGGTGATTAGGARTNLGLVIGTDVQAYNANLAAIAAGTWTGASSITTLGTIGTGTWQGDVITSTYLPTDVVYDADLAAWTGSTNITTLGTIGTGTWQGTAIADAYVADNLTITAGTINNSPIGATTRNSGAFTTLAANSNVNLTGLSTSTDAAILTLNTSTGAVGYRADAANAIQSQATDYTANTSDGTILVSTSGSDVTITLPAANTMTGRKLVIKMITTGDNVIIAADGTDTIDGAATKVITVQWTSVIIQSDGNNWYILSSN